MRKIVTVIAFALIGSGAFAQFNQGRMLVGGSLGFSAQTNKTKTDNATNTNYRMTSFSLTPDFGYFIIDHLAVGAGLGISTTSTKFDGSDVKNSSSVFTLSPFARYYVDPGVFLQANVAFGSHSDKRTDQVGTVTQTVTTKGGVMGWGVALGYAYFLTDNVAIEPMFGYSSVSAKDKDNDSKDVTGGVYLNVGFQIYLGPRN